MMYLLLAAFALCVPAANYLIMHVGTVCVVDGPCLIPVAPGLMAPSGVLMIGISLALRDVIQRDYGIQAALVAIAIGAALSALFAPPALVAAAVISYLACELIDTGVYTPLRKHGLVLAVLASNLVGITVDSIAFLWIAFGDLAYLWGQIVGKLWGTLLGLAILLALERVRSREAMA